MGVSGEKEAMTTFAGEDDSNGAYGLGYVNDGNSYRSGNIRYTLASRTTATMGLAWGFWINAPSGILHTWSEHDACAMYVYGGADDVYVKVGDLRTGNSIRLYIHNSSSYSTGYVTLSADTWYWVACQWRPGQASGGWRCSVYDANGSQVGSEIVHQSATSNSSAEYLVLGSFIGASASSQSGTIWYDDLVMNWTNVAGSHPLGIPWPTQDQHTVTATAGTGGTISPSSALVSSGSTTTFTVTPNTGYSINTVSGCGGTLGGSTYTTGPIAGACMVTASFTQNQYTVTATAGPGGTISQSNALVSHGFTTTFTVTPNAGYAPSVGGTCGGTLVGNIYTTNAIIGPCTVNATFTQGQYTVTATAGTGGTISPSSALVSHGFTTTFTVTPNAGYAPSVGGTCGGTLVGNIYTTNAIIGPCMVNATFTQGQYTVTATAGTGGTISPANALVSSGSTTTFTVIPNTGYSINTVSGCGGTLSGSTYTTGPITGACTVTASFTQNQYTVSTSSGTGGTITPASRLVSHGSTTAFAIIPTTGYSINTVSGCGGTLSGSTYTTGPITGACTVTASFTQNQYSVSTSSGTGGTITPASRLVSHGSTTAFTIIPTTGYSINTVSGCGGTLSGSTYTTGPITGACTVTASFTQNQYSVSTSSGTGGTITPASRLVSHGSTTAFAIIPTTGYSINTVSGCGGTLSGSTYTTGPITGACTVTASFTLGNRAPTTPTLNAPNSSSETLTVTPTISVNASTDPDGDPVTYRYEVYGDSGLSALVAAATTPNTSWTVPALLDNTMYYWRVLASDGTLNSPWMPTANFLVNTTNDPPTGPALNSPANNAHVASLTPVLSVTNATDADLFDTLAYDIEVATDGGFLNVVAGITGTAQGSNGITSWTVAPALAEDTPYYWRAQAKDNHGAVSGWVSASFFVNMTNSAPTPPTLNGPVNAGKRGYLYACAGRQ